MDSREQWLVGQTQGEEQGRTGGVMRRENERDECKVGAQIHFFLFVYPLTVCLL